ncbi:MAG: tRNA1(Val) (adenine(37)-N6)-methyltransferase [Clostridia bacterium]|nr:tRNA1(Val) (adenine(37)-N6)-methyltransferase [Clostridia bacterium]
MEQKLLPGERIDDLQLNDLHIIQSEKGFRFGMDAVILSDFARVRPREHVVDMGTGTGILPILMSAQRTDAVFSAFELQRDMADMAARSVALNGLQERIRIYAEDMRQAAGIIGYGCAHLVTCNPPYGKQGSTLKNSSESVTIARHEEETTIDEWTASCAAVLRNMGRLCMVFPAQRILELTDAYRHARIEPKRIRMVYAKADRAPYLVLLEGMKNAKPGLLWMPPLVVYHPDGTETDEIDRIYHRQV